MLIEAPSDAGRKEFASGVVECPDDEPSQALAKLYKDHFIRCCGSTHLPIAYATCPLITTVAYIWFALTRAVPSSPLTAIPNHH